MLISLHNVISRLYCKHWKCLNSGGVSQTLSANAEINDIAENDVRIYLDNFLHYHFAYDISRDKSIPGARLHDFIINLEKAKLITTDKKEELLLKVKFLNNSSHSFDSYTEEEKRSFVKDVYDSIHKL